MLISFALNLGLVQVASHPLDQFHFSVNVQARGWARTEYDQVIVLLERAGAEIPTQRACTCGISRIIQCQ